MEEDNINQGYEPEEAGITFRSIFAFLKKVGPVMLICCLAFVLVAAGICAGLDYGANKRNKVAQALVQFSFDGISEGLDPLGNKFDASQMKSANNVSEALKSLGLSEKYGVAGVMDAISIEGIVPVEYAKQLKLLQQAASNDPAIIEQISKLVYYSTQFSVTLQYHQVAGMDEQTAKNMVSALILQYDKYFKDKYGKQAVFASDLYTSDMTNTDYIEIFDIYKSELDIIASYLTEMSAKASDWRSDDTMLKFSDLVQKLSYVYTDLNSFESTVIGKGISKNPDQVALYLKNSWNMLVNNQKALSIQMEKQKDIIAKYERQQIIIMGDGKLDTTTIGLLAKAYDDLNLQLATMTARYATLEEQILNLETRLTAFGETVPDRNPSDGGGTGTTRSLRATVPNAADTQVVQQKLDSINAAMVKLVDDINKTVLEYNNEKVISNAMRTDISANIVSIKTMDIPWLIVIVASAVAGCLAGMIVGNAIPKIKKARREKKQTKVS